MTLDPLTGLDLETLELILDSIDGVRPSGAARERLTRARRARRVPGRGDPQDVQRRARHPAAVHPRGVRRHGRRHVRHLPGVRAHGRIDVGVATGVLATFLGSDPIIVGGTPEQKKQWMTRIADEGLLMAYGATEPEAGSDLGALRTTAEPVDRGRRGRRLPHQRPQAVDQQRRRRRRLHRARQRPRRTDVVRGRAGRRPASPTASPRTSTASGRATPPRSSSTTSRSTPTASSVASRARGSCRPSRCSATPA